MRKTGMNVPFVDLSHQFKPFLPARQAVSNSIIERYAFINGPEVKAFEEHMVRWMNISGVCGVSNGKHVICIVLKDLGIGEGDEVFTAPNTVFPAAEAISLSGREFLECKSN